MENLINLVTEYNHIKEETSNGKIMSVVKFDRTLYQTLIFCLALQMKIPMKDNRYVAAELHSRDLS